jgi:hypothetical protein
VWRDGDGHGNGLQTVTMSILPLRLPRHSMRHALWGIVAALVAIIVAVVISFVGETPAGGEGDRLMSLSIRLTELGAPLSLLVVKLADAIGAKSATFPAVYLLLLASILIEWAMAGVIVGWIVQRVRAAS